MAARRVEDGGQAGHAATGQNAFMANPSDRPSPGVLQETYDVPHTGRAEDVWDVLARVALSVGTVVFLAAIVWWAVVLFVEAVK